MPFIQYFSRKVSNPVLLNLFNGMFDVKMAQHKSNLNVSPSFFVESANTLSRKDIWDTLAEFLFLLFLL
jgi:hypothetical protein